MNFLFSPCSAWCSGKKRTERERDLAAVEPSHRTSDRSRRGNKSRVAQFNSTLGYAGVRCQLHTGQWDSSKLGR